MARTVCDSPEHLNRDRGTAHRALLGLKRSVVSVLKMFYIVSFIVICVLLLRLLYVHDPGTVASDKTITSAAYLAPAGQSGTEIDRQTYRDHFHMTDEHVPWLQTEATLCLTCHGLYPHIKDEKTLSLLNLHVGFMACEVCHVRGRPEGEGHRFVWFDPDTEKISGKTEGGYGKYTAMIVPLMNISGDDVRVDRLVSEEFSEMHEKLTHRKYKPEKEHAEVMKIHKHTLSEKAVSCLDCHKKNGYLNFAELGFPEYRINQLVSSEVSRMVGHYKTFYMPKMLLF